MNSTDQAVRYFEYTIGVGDVSAASAAIHRLPIELSDRDAALVPALKNRLRELQEIEDEHGRGAALDLAAPTVKSLIRTGHIDQRKVEAATKYRARSLT